MFSRHGMALYGTVRYFAPAPVNVDLEDHFNQAPWSAVPSGYDVPDYALEAAVSGTLPEFAELPFPSGTLPWFGTPQTGPAEEEGGVVRPTTGALPAYWVYEDASGTLQSGVYTLDREKYWALEVRTVAGVLVREVAQHWNGKVTFSIDEPPALEFSTVTNVFGEVDELTPAELFTLAATYEVWLRDWRGYLMERFEITDAQFVSAQPAEYLNIKAQGLVASLSREPIGFYSTPVTEITNPDGSITEQRATLPIYTIVTELLDLQNRVQKITLGTIDGLIGSEERAWAVEDTNILDALRQLQNTLPKENMGVFYIDAHNRLNWRLNIGLAGLTLSSTGTAPSLRAVAVSARFDEIVTRLYLYGQGQTVDRNLSLLDALNPDEFLDRNTGTYGVRAARKIDNRVKYPESLLNMANRILDETAYPYFEVEIDTLDLVKADGGDYTDVADIWPGSKYALIDPAAEAMGGATVTAQSVTYDLTNPLKLDVKLQSRKKRLSDIFDRIISQLNPKIPEEKLARSLAESDDFNRVVTNTVRDSFTGTAAQDSWFREALDQYLSDYTGAEGDGAIQDQLDDHEGRIQDLEQYGGVRYVKAYEVEEFGDLPTGGSVQTGDIGYVTDTTSFYKWDGDSWAIEGGIKLWTASSKSGLPASPTAQDGHFGLTTGTDKRGYFRVDGVWQCFTHFEAS